MTRVLVLVGLAVLVLALLAGTAGWLAWGTAPTRDGTLDLAGLSAPVAVTWSDSSGVTVEAASLADLAAGLGYAHAADHAWPMVWMRQSARGTAAEWFGDSLRTRDLHARRLALDATARAAYSALPEADRALFDAYAAGVNRALAEPGVAQSDAFVIAGVAPEPWQPWDALTVERLLAWAGTPSPWADSSPSDSSWAAARAASPAVRAFARVDSLFRAGVGLGGMAHGRVFAAPSSEGLALVQHHALGASAADLLVPVRLRVGGRTTVALTIPGTLLLPGGTTADAAWGRLLTSRASVAPATTVPPVFYSRVVERDGDESLVGARRDSAGLVVGRPATRRAAPADTASATPSDAPATAATRPGGTRPGATAGAATPPRVPTVADTVAADSSGAPRGGRWRIAWAGFGTATDAPAQWRLAGGGPLVAPTVQAGTGLVATREGVRVLGTPRVAVADGGVTFVSDAPVARPAAARVALLSRFSPEPATLAADAVSLPAYTDLQPLLAAMGDRDSLATVLQVPFSFLASWAGSYTDDAIGATLYEAWLSAHASITGRAPDPADSLDRALLPFTLRLARAELRDRLGTDVSQWRWGREHAGPRYPVLGSRPSAAARDFHLAPTGVGGHPDAPRPGPATASDAGPAVWTAWTVVGGGRLFVRAPRRRRVTEADTETPLEERGRTRVMTLEAAAGRSLSFRPPARS